MNSDKVLESCATVDTETMASKTLFCPNTSCESSVVFKIRTLPLVPISDIMEEVIGEANSLLSATTSTLSETLNGGIDDQKQ